MRSQRGAVKYYRVTVLRFSCLILVAACAGEPDVVVKNVGRLCAVPAPEGLSLEVDNLHGIGQVNVPEQPLDFSAGRPLLFGVVGEMTTCGTNLEATCSVTPTMKNHLFVQLDASWDVPPVCTREAHRYYANCAVSGLSSGTYEIVFGSARATLEIPSQSVAPCVENE